MEIIEALRLACEKTQIVDRILLVRAINERTLTARLAHHLQCIIGTEYFVDCEYSRMFDTLGADVVKRLSSYGASRVYPDIIVHKRTASSADNLAVIEAKHEDVAEEQLRDERNKIVGYLTEPALRYRFGFLVIFDFPIRYEVFRPSSPPGQIDP